MPEPTRREFLAAAAATPLMGLTTPGNAMTPKEAFVDICRPPDLVRAFSSDGEVTLTRTGDRWSGANVEAVAFHVEEHRLRITFRGTGVRFLQLRWRGDLSKIRHLLGDHWERSYADLEWRGHHPNRVMPWYFMASDGRHTHGYGVMTGANAMCFWTADEEGISLWADIRSGGVPVELGDRTLEVATVLCRQGHGESAFAATRACCKAMAPRPLLLTAPAYGTNDWNYAYGNNSAELIATVSGMISELSPNIENRPFSVIDEGWAMGPYNNKFGYGPWEGNPRFGDMAAFAHRLKGMGIRPGIWIRPLTSLPTTPETGRLSRQKEHLDPTHPETHAHIDREIRKLVDWGYEMIKHDFTSWDIFGKWGFQMGPLVTDDGWRLHDASRTNAEVLKDLYARIRRAAGSAHLIGCNTVGHLTVGTHELQRIGDDTSGVSWNRNRRMGVNTLAFRAAQHGTFFEADPDIVSITQQIPWPLFEQWLRLVSESGNALFVAADPKLVEPKHRTALKKALEIAAVRQPVGEPLDWQETVCPQRWNLRGQEVHFAWMGESGAWPFSD